MGLPVLYLCGIAANGLTLLRKDPGLVAERSGMKPGTKNWDKVLASSTLFGMTGSLLVAGLDLRFSWTTSVTLPLELCALLLVTHTVATGGPYRFVRHPGYVGMILITLLTGPALGSLWALIPGCIGACGSILRTALEDATLQAELPGYREYARQVRFRLIPGLW